MSKTAIDNATTIQNPPIIAILSFSNKIKNNFQNKNNSNFIKNSRNDV